MVDIDPLFFDEQEPTKESNTFYDQEPSQVNTNDPTTWDRSVTVALSSAPSTNIIEASYEVDSKPSEPSAEDLSDLSRPTYTEVVPQVEGNKTEPGIEIYLKAKIFEIEEHHRTEMAQLYEKFKERIYELEEEHRTRIHELQEQHRISIARSDDEMSRLKKGLEGYESCRTKLAGLEAETDRLKKEGMRHRRCVEYLAGEVAICLGIIGAIICLVWPTIGTIINFAMSPRTTDAEKFVTSLNESLQALVGLVTTDIATTMVAIIVGGLIWYRCSTAPLERYYTRADRRHARITGESDK